ncbi:MAG: chorismate mutase [Firmicutes bacterium]|nr:chorismate mutase [Bacillota bacterium]
MDELVAARHEIDEIDRQMAALFEKRMNAVGRVAEYKCSRGLLIYDTARENAVISKNSAYIENEDILPFYVEFMQGTMSVSRHYQRQRTEGLTVAFSGVEGAFASIAAASLFPSAKKLPCSDFKSAYDAVVAGKSDLAVLPIENSTAGEVGQVVDLLFQGNLYVTGIYDLSITQSLVAPKGASLSDIKTVVSHPQALSQCGAFIHTHGFETVPEVNTAVAAKKVAKENDIHTAAIASEETAKLYGLEIIASGINDTGTNTTRFAVLARSPVTDGGDGKHSILMFTVRNEAGYLAKAIDIIGKYGYNMRCLRSRPLKNLLWQYYFYVELEGDLSTPHGKEMLGALSEFCENLKAAGTFKYPASISASDDTI